jgi:N utilization substance protein A
VKNIVRELSNEKIDLFRWSDDIRELVIEALKPAKLKRIEVDEEKQHVRVFVDEENLSLAIGRRGQNARLTAKLTGWEVDVEKEEVQVVGFEEKLQQAISKLSQSLEVDPEVAEQIASTGFVSVEGIAESSVDDLKEALPEMEPDLIDQVHRKAKEVVDS